MNDITNQTFTEAQAADRAAVLIMTKKQQELAMIDEKIRKATEDLEAQRRLLMLLPDMLDFHIAHVSRLYGTVGSVTIERATREDVFLLLELLPPVPLVKCKDGCTSIRAEETVSDEQAARFAEINHIAPVTFKAAHGTINGGERQFDWITKLDGQLISVRVRITSDYALAQWSFNKRISNGSLYIENERFVSDLLDGYALQIRWGSGGPEYTHDYTIYWPLGNSPFDRTNHGNGKNGFAR